MLAIAREAVPRRSCAVRPVRGSATTSVHVNVLVHAPDVVRLFADEGVEAEIGRRFDDGQRLEEGLVAITGVRRPPEGSREARPVLSR